LRTSAVELISCGENKIISASYLGGGSPTIGEDYQFHEQWFLHKCLGPGTVLTTNAIMYFDVSSKPLIQENGPTQLGLVLAESLTHLFSPFVPQNFSYRGRLMLKS
jgi:hypothetical protein